MGSYFAPLNLQFPYFAQYIIMFAPGLLAYRRRLAAKLARGNRSLVAETRWPDHSVVRANSFLWREGWRIPSLSWAALPGNRCFIRCGKPLYVSACAFPCCISSAATPTARDASAPSCHANAYGAYIMQAPVITAVALSMYYLPYHPLLKFVLAALVAVPLCFGVSRLLRLLPYADRVL